MDVTVQNFEEVVTELQQVLPTAKFVAIDEEMTGVSFSGEKQVSIGDRPHQRYQRMRRVANHYSIIQFGLAVFHESSSKEPGSDLTVGAPSSYTCRVYNFYLFPQEGGVNLDGEAVTFNRNHGMDWNKWVREGVTYVNRKKAEELRKALVWESSPIATGNGIKAEQEQKKDQPEKKKEEQPMVLTKPADIEVTMNAVDKLKEWLTAESRKEETEFELITTNGYLRRFMHQQLAGSFPDLQVESRPVEGKRGISTMVVKRFHDAEQRAEEERRKREKEQRKTDQKLGFFRVYELLCESKKPLVGHAIGNDLLFLLASCEGELPDDYGSFKELVSRTVGGGGIYDTQFLCKHTNLMFVGGAKAMQVKEAGDAVQKENGEVKHRFGSMALGNVYATLLEDVVCGKDNLPKTEFPAYPWNPKGYGTAGGQKAFHEAAYDAYITGRVFAMLLELERKEQSCNILEDCKGRLSTWRTMFDGFSLSGEEQVSDGDRVLHAIGLTDVTKDEVLIKALREVLVPTLVSDEKTEGDQREVEVKVTWIDDDSAFVSFPTLPADRASSSLQRLFAVRGGALPALPEVRVCSAQTWLRWGGPPETSTGAPLSPRGALAKRMGNGVEEGEEPAAKRLKSAL